MTKEQGPRSKDSKICQVLKTWQVLAADESGQSVVLLSLVLVVLLSFVGIALDAGFFFARTSQFSAAVDAAVLAGAIELGTGNCDLLPPDNPCATRAEQFLAANGWATSDTGSVETTTELGIPQFVFTATWQLEPFFLRLIGIDAVPVTRSASASYYAHTDMYTTSASEWGAIRKTSQFAAGPDMCTSQGDPVTPLLAGAGTANPTYSLTEGAYRYRIRVPESYLTSAGNLLRIELFDPDSYNVEFGNSQTISHTNSYMVDNPASPGMEDLSCSSGGPGARCIITTNEDVAEATENPYWPVRVDENWQSGCPATADPGNSAFSNLTRYRLYYYEQVGESEVRNDLAQYTASGWATDMVWVSPGIDTGLGAGDDYGVFEVDLSGIPAEDSGYRYVYLDVAAISGSSVNVWDLWAGPPSVADSLPDNVNYRNVALLNNPGAYETKGVAVFAVGYMPVVHYVSGQLVDIPLSFVDGVQGDRIIHASLFDPDNGAQPPVTFYFDTVSRTDFSVTEEEACFSGGSGYTWGCDNGWITPQIKIDVPTRDEELIAFYGGALRAEYLAAGDMHTWFVTITSGRPFLTD